jgi:hypothetical protein
MKFFLLVFGIFLSVQLTAQMSADDKIDEVYRPEFFDNNPELRQAFQILLNERIRYTRTPMGRNEKYTLLSTCNLNNKDNPSLTRDAAFNELTFNPLKYHMIFFSKTTQVYRFDGTDFLIIIAPQ